MARSTFRDPSGDEKGEAGLPQPTHAIPRGDFGDVTEPLERLTRVLGGDAAVADLVDIKWAQPRRWREGQKPDPEIRDRIVGLDAVVALLSGGESHGRSSEDYWSVSGRESLATKIVR